MKTYELKNYNRSRIWFESKEEFFLNKHSFDHSYEFETMTDGLTIDRSLVLELSLARGGRIIYGMLGVNYKYANIKKLHLIIPTIKNLITPIFENSIIGSLEKIYLGIPDEYSNAVYNGVNRAFKENKLLLRGSLNFCYSAYGEVSSCEWIFNILSYMLINLIFLNPKDINEEIIEEILKKSRNPGA